MNRLLIIIGSLLVGLLAMAFAVPAVVDWNRYRGVLEEEATRLIGRSVRVDGRVNVRLLPTPYLHFERLRVADSTAGVGLPLFRAEQFTVWLSPGSLLRGALEATQLELRAPTISLVLDNSGSGNWSGLGDVARRSIFLPSSVELNGVRILDGRITVHDAAARELGTIDHINGELSAASLEGPYKVAAAFKVGGNALEIKGSTAKPQADGLVRIKANVRSPLTSATATLDGTIADALGRTRLTGSLTAKLPLPEPSTKPGAASRGKVADPAVADVTAELQADTGGLQLEKVALAFEQDGRPQLATGEIKIGWRAPPSAIASFKSQWLDLDRVLGHGPDATLLGIAESLVAGAGRLQSAHNSGRLTLTIEQAALAGDLVSDVVVDIERSGGSVQLRRLAASLPGGSHLSLSGRVAPERPGVLLDGEGELLGTGLLRLLGWASRGSIAIDPARDQSFRIAGPVAFGRNTVDFRKATLRLGPEELSGSLNWSATPSPGLTADLVGTGLDIGNLLPIDQAPTAALDKLVAVVAAFGQGTAAGRPAGAVPPTPDIALKLKLDRLRAGAAKFTDVDLELRLASGNLDLRGVRLRGSDGFLLEANGGVDSVLTDAARGALAWTADVRTAAAANDLGVLIGLPAPLRPAAERARHLLPARLAGRIEIGQRSEGGLDLSFDGIAGAADVAGSMKMLGSRTPWLDRAVDLALTLSGKSGQALIGPLLPALASGRSAFPARSLTDANVARVTLRTVGVPRSGMTTDLAYGDGDLDGRLRGTARLDDSAQVAFAGSAEIATPDLARTLATLSQRRYPWAGELALAGKLGLEWKPGRLDVTIDRLKIADTPANGQITYETAREGRPARLGGTIASARLPIDKALAVLTSTTAVADQVPSVQSRSTISPWSDVPFDLGPIGDIETRLLLSTDELQFAPGLAIGRANGILSTKAGRIDLQLTEAQAGGGKLTGGLAIEPQAAGARLSLDGQIAGGKLESFGTAADPVARGSFSLRMAMDGTGLSPRGAFATAGGTGELRIYQAKLARLSPAAAKTVASETLAIAGELPPGDVRRRTIAALAAKGPTIGALILGIDVKDGVMKLAPVTIDGPDGRLYGQTSLGLEALHLDSEWRLEPRADQTTQGDRGGLPAIGYVLAGPLAELTSLEPQLSIDALEREIIVRRLERDVDELERLRRLDEERAAREAERRRLEQERLQREKEEREKAAGPDSRPSDPAAGTAVAPSGPPASLSATGERAPDSSTVSAPAAPAPAPTPTPSTAPSPAVAGSGAKPASPAVAVPPPRPASRPPASKWQSRPFGGFDGGQ